MLPDQPGATDARRRSGSNGHVPARCHLRGLVDRYAASCRDHARGGLVFVRLTSAPSIAQMPMSLQAPVDLPESIKPNPSVRGRVVASSMPSAHPVDSAIGG
jgi:hypothetical protein